MFSGSNCQVGHTTGATSNNESNFVSKIMRQFFTLTGMKQIKTLPYHPQTDRMVERFNFTLKRLLWKLVNNPQTE